LHYGVSLTNNIESSVAKEDAMTLLDILDEQIHWCAILAGLIRAAKKEEVYTAFITLREEAPPRQPLTLSADDSHQDNEPGRHSAS
jgi:hypothetical protein